MEYKKIIAIVRTESLERVEEALKVIKVNGISVSTVKGFGEYTNFFSHGWMVRHARIEIYTPEDKVGEISSVIITTAQTGLAGDGLVAVEPVETVQKIRDGKFLNHTC